MVGRGMLTSGAAVALVLGAMAGAPPAAAGPFDITADIVADRAVTLAGHDAVIELPPGITTHHQPIAGEGTLTVTAPDGPATLILTADGPLAYPADRSRQQVTVGSSGNDYAVTTVTDPDPPTVIVAEGATLQYGDGSGSTGVIGHYPYSTPGFTLNADNIQVDGTLVLAVNRRVSLGTISGRGLVSQKRFLAAGLDLAGEHPFAGVIDNGTGMDVGSVYYPVSFPRLRKILGQGTTLVGSPRGRTVVIGQDIYERFYGNDVNVHSADPSQVVLAGVYSYADSGPDTDPSLSDPALNLRAIPHADNYRGVNIEGANVRFGDGTSTRFFLPGTKETAYINLHTRKGQRARLTIDYNGPVTLGLPISGGGLGGSTMNEAGQGDVTVAGTPGNALTMSAHQNYLGTTTVEAGAQLRLGTGSADGDGGLLTGPGAQVVLDGTLVVGNMSDAIDLPPVSGNGSLVQAGPATATLAAAVSYRGTTTVSGGTLVLTAAAGTLSSGSGVHLTGAGAELDLSQAADQTVPTLSTVTGTTVRLGDRSLTVGVLTGCGSAVGSVTVRDRFDAGCPDGPFTIEGAYSQDAGASLAPVTGGGLRVSGPVSLAGTLVAAESTGSPPDAITVIDNTGSGAVTGTFDGLAEGGSFTIGTRRYVITYTGGTGNDVVLTAADLVSPAPGAHASDGGGAGVAAAPAGAGGGPQAGDGPGAARRGATFVATTGAAGGLLLGGAAVGGLLVRRRRRTGAGAGRSLATDRPMR